MTVTPFKINVGQEVLDDLRSRLANHRWPDEAPDAGWDYGTSLPYLRQLTQYWLEEYDWRAQEAALNELPHFTAEVDGTTLHFLHQPSPNPDAVPLLLVHGWPDSFYRFHRVLPLLKDRFHVVVPSIPGTGFSERVAFSHDKTADLFANLMTEELGYEKFVAGGGDTGSIITLSLAQRKPELLLGIHLTDVGYPDHTTDFASLTPPEQEFAGFIQNWWMSEGAFSMVQATKPQSVAYAFNDSPVGLAGWIMSMMSSLSTGEEIEERFGRDELLTNIMIYWTTETIGSSMRIYRESQIAAMSAEPVTKKSQVPAGVAHCPQDAPLPREWAERKTNLVHFSDLAKGGHFTAWEQPEVWADDVIAFVGKLEVATKS